MSNMKISLMLMLLLGTSVGSRAAAPSPAPSAAPAAADPVEQQMKALRDQAQAIRAQFQTQLQAPGADRAKLGAAFQEQMKPIQTQMKALIDQRTAERRAHTPPALLAIEDAEKQEMQALNKEYQDKRKAVIAKYQAQRQAYTAGNSGK